MAKKDLSSAAAATSKFFTTQTPVEHPSAPPPKVSTASVAENKKVFSFRGNASDVAKWRLYASIRGLKVDDLGSVAMQDYIKRHPLNEIEQALFDSRLNS